MLDAEAFVASRRAIPSALAGALLLAGLCLPAGRAAAQTMLFDFDAAPMHSPLPVDVTVGGVTAHLSATGQGYSIQQAGVLGFTPVGFSGACIYPSSVFAADLLIGFSRAVHYVSIMYAPEEYGCDFSAVMRIDGYANGAFVATATATAPNPGTWPTGTLILSTAQPFDSVVVHYDTPPACGDWGPVFMADNMTLDASAMPAGDANGDGFVTVADVFYFINFLFAGGPSLATPGDVNADGFVNVGDVFYLVNYLFAGGPSPQ